MTSKVSPIEGRGRALIEAASTMLAESMLSFSTAASKADAAVEILSAFNQESAVCCSGCYRPMSGPSRTTIYIQNNRMSLWLCESCDGGARVRVENTPTLYERGIDQGILDACARAAHEVNRAYCMAHGSSCDVPPWEVAPGWQKESALEGIRRVLSGYNPEELHYAWMKDKLDAGWTLGQMDPDRRTHPFLVPYAELTDVQKEHDFLFLTTVRAVAVALGWKPDESMPHTTRKIEEER